jgi:hypothetical protein
LNVVGLVEGAGLPALGIVPPVTLKDGVLDVTIKLTHPFANARLTGFDVRGILIGHGSMGGFTESMFYAGPDDMELLNADGHTRLWNPTGYTGKGYVDGKLGTPDAIANFTATLNGYKYFADDLTADMPVQDMVKSKRGAFTVASSNTRHYRIRLGNKGLTFQYAIDANWFKPTDPVVVPDSFDVTKANCPEPYHIEGWVGPGIWGGGGQASVRVDVWDWQKDVDHAYVEAPSLFNNAIELSDPEDFGEYVRFTGTIMNYNETSWDSADVLFYARGTDPVTSTLHTDYRLYHLPVVHVPSGGVIITIQDDAAYKTIGNEYTYGGADYDWSAGNPSPVDYNDTVGPWDFTPIPNDSSGVRAALAKTDPEVASFAGDFDPYVSHFFKTEWILDGTPHQIYQAELDDIAGNKLKLWGVYEETILQGSMPFSPPVDFPYPMDTSTQYHLEEEYNIIPVLLKFTVAFDRWGLGQGVTFITADPGVNDWGWDAYATLLTRMVISAETSGVLGQGPLGKGLVYEWIADNGTTVASITSGNSPDGPPNFDESTFQIVATGVASSLRSID